MKQLIIAEKPSVARDLAKVLGANEKTKTYIEGKNVIITWALGHLLTLKMPEDYNKEWREWSFETLPMIPKKSGIKPLPKTTGQLKSIQRLAKRSDISEAIIATDAGREGELVARWILEYVRFNKPVKRLWISSQTEKAIKLGFKQLKPAKDFDNLFESALARSEADWLVGLNVTRALTVKYQDSLSAGRVQTPTLALVRKQDQKIEQFKAKHYYVIQAELLGLKTRLGAAKNLLFASYEEAKAYQEILTKSGEITSIKESTKTEQAPLPYDLTELQQEANQRFGYSAKKTLSIMQGLYETHKVVTYPRTDSKYLTRDMQETMRERLQAVASYYPEDAQRLLKNGAKVVQAKVFQDNRVTDHHGIIPTEQRPNSVKMTTDDNRIYQMIASRFLGLFEKNYQERRQAITVNAGNEELLFKQQKIVELGWKIATKGLSQVELLQGQTYSINYEVIKETTTAPPAMTEATLLGKMEKFNLGTPATRAEIIERLISSEMVERQQNRLHVTPKGQQLLTLVNPDLVTPELTEKWEKQLEDIAKGQLSREVFIREIENETRKLVKEIKFSEKEYKDHSLTSKECPDCGQKLKEKSTKNGKIYVCSNQECTYSRRKDPKLSNHRCPQCHKKMTIIQGKNGDFFKCQHCAITEKITTKQERKKKMTKHEERRLLKKYSQVEEPEESPLALALKAAMEK